MTHTYRHESAICLPDEVDDVPRRCTLFRQTVLLACKAALALASRAGAKLEPEYAGIALFTDYGERFPTVYRELHERNKKLRPSHFEMAIHNSAAGYVAIQLGLKGPQIVLVSGNIHLVAELQLLSHESGVGRADLMLVCEANGDMEARCYVLEAV